MTKIGSFGTEIGKKAMLLGSGELGKEVAIELVRLGVEVVACDRYEGAPAMQIAQKSRTFNMLDGEALRSAIEEERPDHIIPEVEAIATPTLVELEKEGFNVTPTANAARLTMNREGIRRLAAETLGVPTSPYRFASTEEEFKEAIKQINEYKMEINDYLDIMMIWYRDVLLYKATADVNHLVFRDEIYDIKKSASKSSYEGIEQILEALEKAKVRLNANVNFDLVIELLLLTIKEN